MNKLIKRIEKAVNDDGFTPILSLEFILKNFSSIFGKITSLRCSLYKKRILKARKLPCTVISVGNITAGGTGKTPFTILLAEILKELNYSPAVISRGYKGSASKVGGIVSDGSTILMTPQMAGDEPFMMSKILKSIPVLIGRDRFKSGMLAINAFKSDIIIMDDGFQHLKLERDINILLMDSARPFGNGYLLPRGPLRESLSGLLRADICILTRSDKAMKKDVELFKEKINKFGIPCFSTIHKPIFSLCTNTGESELSDINYLKGKSVFVFSGIAQNNDFIKTIKSCMCNIVDQRNFSDHYNYSKEDLDKINHDSFDKKIDLILTTQKDYVKINWYKKWKVSLGIIDIRIEFTDDKDLFIKTLNEMAGAIE